MLRRLIGNSALRRVLLDLPSFSFAAEFATWVADPPVRLRTDRARSVGVVALIQLVPAALLAPAAAALGTVPAPSRILLAGYLVQAVAMLATAAAMVPSTPVPIVYAAAAVAASSLVVTRPTADRAPAVPCRIRPRS